MPFPSLDDYEVIARAQGITLTPERLAAAHATHAAAYGDMQALRSMELDFLAPVEPSAAIGWIASGGRS